MSSTMFSVYELYFILFGLLSFCLFHILIEQLKHMPLTSAKDIEGYTLTSVLRLFGIVANLSAASYAFFRIGHHIMRWGGLELLLSDEIELISFFTPVIGITLFTLTTTMYRKILDQIAIIENLAHLDQKEMERKIKSEKLKGQTNETLKAFISFRTPLF